MKRTLGRNFNSGGRNSTREHEGKDTFDCQSISFSIFFPLILNYFCNEKKNVHVIRQNYFLR